MSMRLDLDLVEDSSEELVITWTESDTGVPQDLTGYTAKCQFRVSAESGASPILSLTDEDKIELGGTAGTLTLTIACPQAGQFVWDLFVFDGANVPKCLFYGNVNVRRRVSR